MAQAGGGLGVAQEALDALGVVERAGPGDLEGDVALQLRVMGAVNGAEASVSQPGADQEPADVSGQVRSARLAGRQQERIVGFTALGGRGGVGIPAGVAFAADALLGRQALECPPPVSPQVAEDPG
jgi:hypothetical protein